MIKLDMGTLAGILSAQRKIDNLIPVISCRQGLLQELQAKVASLNREECIELMNALIALQSHCRALSCVEFDLVGVERS